jgi:CHAD domain-containing protein
LEEEAFLAKTGRARIDQFQKRLRRAAADPSSEEAIHDLRVSIRRVLAWIAVRSALLGPDRKLPAARSSLNALMSPLGKLRDAHVKRDVIRTILPKGDEPSYLYALLVASDVRRWEESVRRLLGRKSARRIRVPLPRARTGRGSRPEASARASRHLAKLRGAVDRHREGALDPLNPEALHRMRLAFKKYRYAAEVFLPLFPKATAGMAERLHDFQTLLGTIHDCDVILAEAAAFRRDILGREEECALEIAFRAFREKNFREFREIAGTAGGLSRVFGTTFRT